MIYFVIPRKLLDELNEGRGYSHLKEKFLDCIKWRDRFRKDYGLDVRESNKRKKYVACYQGGGTVKGVGHSSYFFNRRFESSCGKGYSFVCWICVV